MIPLASERRIPAEIEMYAVRVQVLEAARDYFRAEGGSQYEGFMCWSGQVDANRRATIESCIFPPSEGLERGNQFAHLDIAATANIANQIRERGELLLAQLHTHPGTAFHSSVDDRGSISERRGFLSIVVPHYGRLRFFDAHRLLGCSVNEHVGGGRWREWSQQECRRRLRIDHGSI